MIKNEKIDYQTTLFLPKTDFSMRASLSEKEPVILKRWKEINLYKLLREQSSNLPTYIVHDGPPYANGDIHIGHALNKILKDIVVRSFQMRGYNANYVPGWDCHGLPIEWKIEENYTKQGKTRKDIPVLAFRQECRNFATGWMKIQSEQFQRLGVIGNFSNPYTTMDFVSEASIAEEFLKFARTDQIYRGSKPVMWSVVERTALAEAEVEYRDYESDMVWVSFPLSPQQHCAQDLKGACVVIWTTTPWTIPGNRAVAFSPRISYGLYCVRSVENNFGPQKNESFLLADALAHEVGARARVELERVRDVLPQEIEKILLDHPLKGLCGSYHFPVPLLAGQHVTQDAGSGFVHTAPSHGREDFELWIASHSLLTEKGIKTDLPFMVDDEGFFTDAAPGFNATSEGKAAQIITQEGKKGDANERVIHELINRKVLFAKGRLKHAYPHSWRSGKPVIFRNTPQWFISMDKPLEDGTTLRQRALKAVEETHYIPASGKNRLYSMVSDRPDWVISRQRVWGVPLTLFIDESGQFLKNEEVNKRILEAFKKEGADAWFTQDNKRRFLGDEHDHERWNPVNDILDVWFDSGTTHAFALLGRDDLDWPADLYLEGSDQHRGWFQSSLLESCSTRGRAPFKTIITHGFTLDESGRKMSKSLGNTLSPDKIMERSGADILRLWVASVEYREDQRLGEKSLQTTMESYRKLRNTLRWMLGTLAHDTGEETDYKDMPELERFMLHALFTLDASVRNGFDSFEFKRVVRVLTDFMILDLSSFYFDIRKDALYCDAPSSIRRQSSLTVIKHMFHCLSVWLAPILPFTTEEAWLEWKKDAISIHIEQFPVLPSFWHDKTLGEKWSLIRQLRRVVTGALEIARAEKKIGSSLQASPLLFITDKNLYDTVKNLDFDEICITSGCRITNDQAPQEAFFLEEVKNIAVLIEPCSGEKCARSWRYTDDIGVDPEFPDVSARDAAALREILKK